MRHAKLADKFLVGPAPAGALLNFSLPRTLNVQKRAKHIG